MNLTAWLTFVLLVLAGPLCAQTGSGLGNMNLADTKAKDPALVAAQHLARADRALAKALHLRDEADPKTRGKVEKAGRRAEREATAALENDAGAVRAYRVRGQARLILGDPPGAQHDCRTAVGYLAGDSQALLCYGQASLALGEGGQALSAYARLIEDGELQPEAGRLRAGLEAWIDANPQGEAQQNAARWLADHSSGRDATQADAGPSPDPDTEGP